MPPYVEQRPDDCVNTYQLRMIVTASKAGAAVGEFEGVRYAIERKGTSPDTCWLEMHQFDGRLKESTKLKCVFQNPLDGT